MENSDLKQLIRDVPDFPKKGIVFKDITPLLADPRGLKKTLDRLIAPFEGSDIEAVAGIESRGFIFGVPLAERLGVGFVPIRKPGKLPSRTISQSYALEYGTDSVEIHADALRGGQRVLLVDDLLATGGTACAAIDLMRKLGAEVVGAAFVIELAFLEGRAKLRGVPIRALLSYG